MGEFLHKHYKKILMVNMTIFVVSLLIVSFSTEVGINKITAFTPKSTEEVNFFFTYRNLVFSISLLIFILNLLFISLLSTLYKPEKFLIGRKKSKYDSSQKIVQAFMQSVVKTHSKLTDNNYTLYLLNVIKKKNIKNYPFLKFINLKLEKSKRLNVKIDSQINSIDNKQLKETLQLIIDQLSISSDEKDPYKKILRYNMELDLVKTLENIGVDI